MLEGLQLVRLKLTLLVANEIDLLLREMDHFADHGAEEAGFSGADLTDDNNELAFLDLQVDVLNVEDMVE